MRPRRGQRPFERRPVRALAALDPGELANNRPVANVEVFRNGRALRLNAEAALTRLPVLTRQYATNFQLY